MGTIAKSFEFAASHRLYRPEWSDQRNREVFGKCANPNGHGPNYRLEVQVSGELNQET
ncbi:MAG: 6-carboxytetrahydropterin synthase [Bdellovibrionales bacterium]|nr:6-carboxytetrahydropterin synthase [Bdellovibrionales bacterium]